MNRKFPNLFTPIEIAGLKLRNRICSAPMSHPNITSEGLISPEMTAFYELRAKGGAAVVTISEAVTHIKTGKSHNRHINLEEDHVMLSLSETARAIKCHGAAASIELSHGGKRAEVDAFNKDAILDVVKYGASDEVAPNGQKSYEMPKELIREVVDSYGVGAALCKRAGFDMIMVHGGHGWLIQQFLSPLSNRRTDEYGGSLENRTRLAIEILDSVRAAVGPSFPIEFRISAEEYVDGGYDLSDAIKFAKLVESKIDLLHVSTGNLNYASGRTHPSMFLERGCNVSYAEELKKHVSIPVAAIGAIADPVMMEDIIASGKADLVYTGRAMIADPYLPYKAKVGRESEIHTCIRCNVCFAGRVTTKSRLCSINPIIGREREFLEIGTVKEPKKVLVAGGGPGGMQAAITAAQRGHKVILCEKSGELGGAIKQEKGLPFKEDACKLAKSKEIEMRKAGVELRLNTAVTEAYAEKEAPDVLIVAIGAVPVKPPIEGIDGPNVIMAEEAINNRDLSGKNVVILGGGLVGCELAIYLSDSCKEITLVEMTDTLAEGENGSQKRIVNQEIADKKNILVRLESKGRRVTDDGLVCTDKNGVEEMLYADKIICATGQKPLYDEAKKLLDCAPDVVLLGDCIKPANIREAVSRGFHAGIDIQ